MYPELFKIPFTELTIKSYGTMMVVGFLLAVWIIRRLSRDITPNPEYITNASLYSLVAGVVGARLFYVIHYFDHFKDQPLRMFAVWEGGLELLGGVILAVLVIFLYLRHHKLPIRKYLDILAIGLFVALAFGRMGCFLNGCCFGKPTDLPWAVRFPYNSISYISQINSDPKRNRPEPYLQLPDEYIDSFDRIDATRYPKPLDELTPQQKEMVLEGPYRALPVHPTQLYSSANGLFCAFLLYLYWRRNQNARKNNIRKPLMADGSVFALMFMLYGTARFFLEFVRDDNPYEYGRFTVSQIIGAGLVIFGIVLLAALNRFQTNKAKSPK